MVPEPPPEKVISVRLKSQTVTHQITSSAGTRWKKTETQKTMSDLMHTHTQPANNDMHGHMSQTRDDVVSQREHPGSIASTDAPDQRGDLQPSDQRANVRAHGSFTGPEIGPGTSRIVSVATERPRHRLQRSATETLMHPLSNKRND